MFVWTPEHVLRAIDAGIPEVIRLHNRAYTNLTTHGLGLHGNPHVGLTPYFSPRIAYAVAMEQTVAVLNATESMIGVPVLPITAIPTVAEGRFLDALFG